MSGSEHVCLGGDTFVRGCSDCNRQREARHALAQSFNPFAIEQEATLHDAMRTDTERPTQLRPETLTITQERLAEAMRQLRGDFYLPSHADETARLLFDELRKG